MTILPGQCRAARALLDWSQGDLVDHAGVAKKTITDFERGLTHPHLRTLERLTETFTEAGIIFIFGAAPGARLARAAQTPLPPPRRRGRHRAGRS